MGNPAPPTRRVVIPVLVVSAVVVISAVSVPLALGLAATVCAVVAAALRRSGAGDLTHGRHLSRADALPPVNVAEPRHRAVAQVDPSVFDDLVATEAEALKVFSAWLRQHPHAPQYPTRFVSKSEVGTRFVGRLVSAIEQATFSWHERPYRGTEDISPQPSLIFNELAPATDEEVRDRTRYITACSDCGGEGKLTCGTCIGRESVKCPNCDGAKKAYGIAKNGSRRLMKCKVCGAKGEVPCHTCDEGQVPCSSCEGYGKRERWAVPRRTVRNDVQLEPDGKLISAFEWGRDGFDAPAAVVARDARIHATVTADARLSPDEVEQLTGPRWFSEHWAGLQPSLALDETVVSQTFELLEVPSVAVTWGVEELGEVVTEFKGLRMLAPPPIDDTSAFLQRAKAMQRNWMFACVLPVSLLLGYVFRGAYFARADAVGVISLAAATAVLLALALSRAAERGRRPYLPAVGAVMSAVLACSFAVRAEPSPLNVERLIVAGDISAAERALAALRRPAATVSATLRRQLDRKIVLATATSYSASSELRRLPKDSPERLEGEHHLDALLLAEARALLDKGQLRAAELTLVKVVHAKADAQAVQREVAKAIATDCLTREEFPCVFQRADEAGAKEVKAEAIAKLKERIQETEARLREARRADPRAALALTHDLVPRLQNLLLAEPDAAKALAKAKEEQGRLAAKVKALEEREREIERQRAEAEAKRLARERERAQRQAEAAARREAQRLERERRRANMPRRVRCCDGSLSPSCYYGGSLRGCCSYHGGVC